MSPFYLFVTFSITISYNFYLLDATSTHATGILTTVVFKCITGTCKMYYRYCVWNNSMLFLEQMTFAATIRLQTFESNSVQHSTYWQEPSLTQHKLGTNTALFTVWPQIQNQKLLEKSMKNGACRKPVFF